MKVEPIYLTKDIMPKEENVKLNVGKSICTNFHNTTTKLSKLETKVSELKTKILEMERKMRCISKFILCVMHSCATSLCPI